MSEIIKSIKELCEKQERKEISEQWALYQIEKLINKPMDKNLFIQ
jgi:hypothetical protein